VRMVQRPAIIRPALYTVIPPLLSVATLLPTPHPFIPWPVGCVALHLHIYPHSTCSLSTYLTFLSAGAVTYSSSLYPLTYWQPGLFDFFTPFCSLHIP
jgi:hypothetical protein